MNWDWLFEASAKMREAGVKHVKYWDGEDSFEVTLADNFIPLQPIDMDLEPPKAEPVNDDLAKRLAKKQALADLGIFLSDAELDFYPDTPSQ